MLFRFCLGTSKVTNSRGDRKLRAIHLGVKGDLPALSKVGYFKRSFSRVPRSIAGKCVGVCFLCLAGRETQELIIPYEDFSAEAAWKATFLTELPYDNTPPIMTGLPWGPPNQGPNFFKHDFWHNWHNGVAKLFVASAFVEINTAGILEGGSIDARFESLTEHYRAFCNRANISPYLKFLTRDTFGMESTKVFPNGSWNKAVVSTELMLFLGDFCNQHIQGRTDDELLLAVATGLGSLSRFCCMVVCYTSIRAYSQPFNRSFPYSLIQGFVYHWLQLRPRVPK